jgi:hypothetical protein
MLRHSTQGAKEDKCVVLFIPYIFFSIFIVRQMYILVTINCVTQSYMYSSHHLIVNQLRQTGYHNNRNYSAFNILTCIRLDL